MRAPSSGRRAPRLVWLGWVPRHLVWQEFVWGKLMVSFMCGQTAGARIQTRLVAAYYDRGVHF
jgi:hypothetical protein